KCEKPAKGQKDCKLNGRNRLTKSMAEIRRVFAADRQMYERYESVSGCTVARMMHRCSVISVAKYANWSEPLANTASCPVTSILRLSGNRENQFLSLICTGFARSSTTRNPWLPAALTSISAPSVWKVSRISDRI